MNKHCPLEKIAQMYEQGFTAVADQQMEQYLSMRLRGKVCNNYFCKRKQCIYKPKYMI